MRTGTVLRYLFPSHGIMEAPGDFLSSKGSWLEPSYAEPRVCRAGGECAFRVFSCWSRLLCLIVSMVLSKFAVCVMDISFQD